MIDLVLAVAYLVAVSAALAPAYLRWEALGCPTLEEL